MKFNNKYTFVSIYDEDLFPKEIDRTAFIYKDEKISFRSVKEKVDEVCAHLISMGVIKGSKVGYTLPNCPETFYLYMALSRLGACAVPLFPMIPDQGKMGIWTNCGVEFVVTLSSMYSTLKAVAEQFKSNIKFATLDNSDASYCFTNDVSHINIEESIVLEGAEELPVMMAMSSGTTGASKFVEMTQKNASTVLKASYKLMQPKEEGYSLVLAFPLSTSGILVCMGMFAAGVTTIFSEDMSPMAFLSLVDKYKAEAISAPPAYLEAISFIPGVDHMNFDSVERVYSGMDFFRNKLLNSMRRRFKNLKMAGNGYGLVETSTVLMIWNAESVEDFNNPTNQMIPVEGIGNEFSVRSSKGEAIAVGSEGELFIKGNSIVKGYFRNEEETNKAFINGWFRTGDVAIANDDSTITLLGRNKDIIKRGGRSISPITISSHINKVDAVIASAVVGVPHEMYGEMIWAFIVTPPGVNLPEGVIMKHCRESLPPYMVPDQITFVDQLPKNPGVGKLDNEKMKEMALEELSQMSGVENE